MLFLLLWTPAVCVWLQGMSRNLIYIFIGVASIIANIAVLLYEEKGKKRFLVPAFLTNAVLFVRCIQLHIAFGDVVYDYLFAAALLVLFTLVLLITIIPTTKPTSQ